MNFDRPTVHDTDIPSVIGGYGLGEPVECRYLGGIPNMTFSFRTDRGPFVVRVCNNGYTSVAHLESEVRALEHLHRHGFDLAPKPVRGLDGHLIQRWSGYRVLVTEYIDGTSADKLVIGPEVCEDVGAAVAGLNRAMASFDHGLPESESYRSRAERLFELFATNDWPVDWPTVLAQWQRAMTELEDAPGFAPVAIHSDIWPPNVICRDGRVVGLVDFDDMAVGPVHVELAAVLTEFAFAERAELDEPRALAVLRGFLGGGGRIDPGQHRLLVSGIEVSCASWVGANVLHGVSLAESLSLLRTLEVLATDEARRAVADRLEALCRQAGSYAGTAGSEGQRQRQVRG